MIRKIIVLLFLSVLISYNSMALGFPHRLFPAKVLKKAVSLVVPRGQK